MTWDQQQQPFDADPAPPASTSTPNQTTASTGQPYGFRRAILTAGMAAALLVTGGTAIVLAASPDPSVSSAPSTTQPSTGGSTAPENGQPGTPRQGHGGQPCPDGGNGSNGSDSSGEQSGQPAPSTTAPAT